MEIQSIVNQLIAAALVTLVGYALKLAGDYIKTKRPDFAVILDKAVEMAVNAVEQMAESGQLAEMDKKKDIALGIASHYLETLLATKGLKIDVDLNVISDLIEAKVWELINSKKYAADLSGQG